MLILLEIYLLILASSLFAPKAHTPQSCDGKQEGKSSKYQHSKRTPTPEKKPSTHAVTVRRWFSRMFMPFSSSE